MFDLKESDLPELERLERVGMKWAARDMETGLWAYLEKPIRTSAMWVCGNESSGICRTNEANLQCVSWSDPEPLNIAAAIEQIKAGMRERSATEIPGSGKPLTWNDRINQMTVEEKAKLFDSIGFCMNGFVSDEDCNANKDCMSCALKWLASPYTEGEKK